MGCECVVTHSRPKGAQVSWGFNMKILDVNVFHARSAISPGPGPEVLFRNMLAKRYIENSVVKHTQLWGAIQIRSGAYRE